MPELPESSLLRLLASPLTALPAVLGAALPSLCQLRGDGCTGWAQQGVACDACLHHYGYARYASVQRCIQCAQVLRTAPQPLHEDQGGCEDRIDRIGGGGEFSSRAGENQQAAGIADRHRNTAARQWRCGHCLRLRPALQSCHAAVAYTGVWRQVMARFKPGQQAGGSVGNPALADLAAQLMLTSPDIRSAVAQADVLLPIPSHRVRVAARGFAPAGSIARALRRQSRCSAPVVHALALHRSVEDQRRLNRMERFANMQGAFAVTAVIRKCTGRHVVLVDDVITTGATLFAAAQALQASEPASVQAVVWARTPS